MCVCLKNTLVTCAMFAPVCVCTNAYYIYVYMTNIIYMVILFFSFLIASIPLSARGPTHTHFLAFSVHFSPFTSHFRFPTFFLFYLHVRLIRVFVCAFFIFVFFFFASSFSLLFIHFFPYPFLSFHTPSTPFYFFPIATQPFIFSKLLSTQSGETFLKAAIYVCHRH